MKGERSMKNGQMSTFLSRQIALSLICKKIKSLSTNCNLKRSYSQKHAAKFDAYQGMFCKDKLVEQKKSLPSQQLFGFFF